jgi:hypothetical protein
MKKMLFLLFVLSAQFVSAQSDLIAIPERTQISMILTEDLIEGKCKVGQSAKFVISEDVLVNGVVVISKKTPVVAKVTISGKRELRVEMSEVPAVDGTPVKLLDCWKFTTAAQNLNGKVALLPKNTIKICASLAEVKIKAGGGKY